MRVFEFVIALLLIGAGLTALSRRIGAPYPALVALAGAALALIPSTPTLVLDPELALTLFVAPVLLDAAFDASQRDLRANWRAVAGLAIGAVVLTIAAVALVARALVPDMSWPVAIALGAIVAPPDAAAATAVLKQLRPPHRLLVILEGESLFNDASALLIYRLALGAAVAGVLPARQVVPMLAWSLVGSVGLGIALSRVLIRLIGRIQDVAIAVVVQFCSTFAIWILAEALHLSGILTMVAFAMAASQRAAEVTPARIRIPSYAVWEFAVFVLNVLAFILVGFQLKGIVARIETRTLVHYVGVAAAVCGVTILSRFVWVSAAAAVRRLRARRRQPEGAGGRRHPAALNMRAATVIGWCGMRGIVTLAAALGLPTGGDGGPAFPHRDLVLFTAFAVVLVTLVVQGLTLRPLMNALHLEDDRSVEREVSLARVETLRAALSAIAAMPSDAMSELLRRRYEVMLQHAEALLAGDDRSGPAAPNAGARSLEADAAIVRRATTAERRRLLALRADGTIGDAAFQQIEQELDLEELDLSR
jgi:monovalent cation/hydrogen antiporter